MNALTPLEIPVLSFKPRPSFSFNSPVALIFTLVANLLLFRWIISTTGQFTRNIKGSSNILRRNGCYGYGPYWQSCTFSFENFGFYNPLPLRILLAFLGVGMNDFQKCTPQPTGWLCYFHHMVNPSVKFAGSHLYRHLGGERQCET